MNKYIDKNGAEITIGSKISIGGDTPEEVFAVVDPYGHVGLGVNASNPSYLAAHLDADQEFYPLTEFNYSFVDERTIQMNDTVIVEGIK